MHCLQIYGQHIVPAHGALTNLVDAMEVEITHRVEALGVGCMGQ